MILTQAFLAGPQAMDAVGIQDYQSNFEPEADTFTLSLAAFREALETEEGVGVESLGNVDTFRTTFRGLQRARNVGGFHDAWLAFSMLLRGIPERSRSHAAARVRRAISLFTANVRAVEEARADLSAPVKVTPQSHPALYRPVSGMDLPKKAIQRLLDSGILYIGDLVQLSFADAQSNLSRWIPKISLILNDLNLRWGMNLDGFDRAEAERLTRK